MAERLERMEGWMIKEKVQGKALSAEANNPSGTVAKKPSGSGPLKKEVESGGVETKKERGKDRYHPYAAAVTTPVGNPPVPQQQPPPQQKALKAKSQVKKGSQIVSLMSHL